MSRSNDNHVPYFRYHERLPEVSYQYRKMSNFTGDIIAVKVGSIASDDTKSAPGRNEESGICATIQEYSGKDRKESMSHESNSKEAMATSAEDVIASNNPLEGIMYEITRYKHSHSSDIDTDEDHRCETESSRSAENYVSDTSDEGQNGYNTRIFYIHKDILCRSSRFFQAATKAEWSGQRKQPIDLSHEDPALFELYVQWLYVQKVPICYDPESEERPAMSLMRSHILGDRLMDTKYQNSVMESVLLFTWPYETLHPPYHIASQHLTIASGFEGNLPTEQMIRFAYERTLPSSPLRRAMIDIWVWKATKEWTSGDLVQRLGAEATNDLIKSLVRLRLPPGKEIWGHLPSIRAFDYRVMDAEVKEEDEDIETAESDISDSNSV